MSADLSIIRLILDASIVVQLVMLLLVLASLFSWTLIFVKGLTFKRSREAADQFERRFWSGAELGELYKRVSARRGRVTGMEAIFESGFREYVHLHKQGNVDPMSVLEGAQRAMRVA